MAIRIITSQPAALLEKLEQQLHYTDSRWGVNRQNGYFQRSRDSALHYYYRYKIRDGAIDIQFMDVDNQYSTHSVNEYAGEFIAAVLTIFTGDSLLTHLEVKPYSLPNY